jgi:hypothetical protein
MEPEEIAKLKTLLEESGYSSKIADLIIAYYLKPAIA